jgi:hypothetical protein
VLSLLQKDGRCICPLPVGRKKNRFLFLGVYGGVCVPEEPLATEGLSRDVVLTLY